MLAFAILILGFILLIYGADFFVDGASALANKIGIPPLIVGLTVVALGTSAPELAVSITAGLQNANEIAVGNVLGSNLFNLLIVAGCSAIVCPQIMDKELLRRDWPATLGATALLGVLVFWDRQLSSSDGLILCFCFVLVISFQVISALRNKRTHKEVEILSPREERAQQPVVIIRNLIVGLSFIIIGSQFTVTGASDIARLWGLTETVIGLTVVAFGTSLPELVTSLSAARKGQNDIAMGNVIGSCLFNVLFILGVSCAITPIPVLETGLMDFGILLVVTALLYIPAKMGKFGRTVGAVSILSYAGYMTWVVMR